MLQYVVTNSVFDGSTPSVPTSQNRRGINVKLDEVAVYADRQSFLGVAYIGADSAPLISGTLVKNLGSESLQSAIKSIQEISDIWGRMTWRLRLMVDGLYYDPDPGDVYEYQFGLECAEIGRLRSSTISPDGGPVLHRGELIVLTRHYEEQDYPGGISKPFFGAWGVIRGSELQESPRLAMVDVDAH